jgi:glycosyltransferase involved in cell wall biosynthesis
MVTALTVSYNTPELLRNLLSSFRRFYDNPYLVVDGSEEKYYERIKGFEKEFNINLIHFDTNIHHGGGLAYGLKVIQTSQILFLDSDITILKGGFIEDLQNKLRPESYGIGDISEVNEFGVNIPNGIKYLHPSFALINREVALSYPLPMRHGAPMLNTMKATPPIQHEQWIADDLKNSIEKKPCVFFIHEWCGTVSRTGGYNL